MASRILIVEGEKSYREFLVDFFQGREFDAAGCADHAEAIKKLADGSFDIVITDFTVEKRSAEELCELINTQYRDCTSLIVINSDQTPESERRIRRFSPAFYLVKPFAIEDLFAVVLKLAARRERAELTLASPRR